MDVRIYLTNLAQYNNGRLLGKWLTLPLSEEELSAEIKAVLGNDEEYFITDYEADFSIEEYDSLIDLNSFAEELEQLNEYDQQRVIYLLENVGINREEALAQYEDVSFYPDKSLEEVADEFVEEGLFGEIPERLQYYIDTEKIARDLDIDGYHETKKGVFHYA